MTPRFTAPLLSLLAASLLAACQVPVRPDAEPAPLPPVPAAPPADATPPAAPASPAPVEAPAAPPPLDNGAEVFDRLAARFTAPACIKGSHNREWRRRYAGHPASFSRHVASILPLMAYVLEEVERRDLPGEFVLIPIVESWYRPEAIGPGGPAGMWQMIASTARNHGIRIQPGYDGRLSPVDSTRAALDYLETVSALFGNEWRATAMGYNAGEYRITRALAAEGSGRVSGERRLPRGLSNTTYAYVAKMRALACLLSRPERHGLELPRDVRFTPLRAVELPAGVDRLEAAAPLLGTDASTLRALNPAYRQGRVVAGAPRVVLAPRPPPGQALAVAAVDPGSSSPAPAPAARVHVVVRGDTLSAIASTYGVPLAQLLRLNALRTASVLRIGQSIRVDP